MILRLSTGSERVCKNEHTYASNVEQRVGELQKLSHEFLEAVLLDNFVSPRMQLTRFANRRRCSCLKEDARVTSRVRSVQSQAKSGISQEGSICRPVCARNKTQTACGVPTVL